VPASAEVAVDAICQLPEDRRQLYLDVILMALPAAIRRILEARMQGYEYQSDFARKYYGQGISEGLERGRKKGKREGKKAGLRAAVITLARTKLGELPDEDIAAIEAVSDQRILTELVTLLGQARSARKARAALVRALAR
jgi:predicted transposase YdaD